MVDFSMAGGNLVRRFAPLLMLLVSVAAWGAAPGARPPAAPARGGRASTSRQSAPAPRATPVHRGPLFTTSDNCLACHNNLTSPSGEDLSIGVHWRGSMMAHSARDPYWQASVRRETIDHPDEGSDIEDECAICHMPMARAQVHAEGRTAGVFATLARLRQPDGDAALALDGVSCTMCHQIRPEKLGTSESFTGGFVIDTVTPVEERRVYGPFEVDKGRATIMRSATGFAPVDAAHIRQPELCATCHTLITTALGPNGEAVGRLPEQVPYQEWLHSDFKDGRTCQDCHMPAVTQPAAITSVLGKLRDQWKRHEFVGGNFFVLGMLNRYRGELGVEAPAQDLNAAVRRTREFLRDEAAKVRIENARVAERRLVLDVGVDNLAGHKLPTGYPSRRAWLHVIVRRQSGPVVFESGALAPSGLIVGNGNDADPLAYEPHYTEIRTPDQVQIYESVLADGTGAVTTGLLRAVRYAKDNRLLPCGFDKATAEADVAVHGAALGDADFGAGADRVRYSVEVGDGPGPFEVIAELVYQPIGFRWAQNLKGYDAPEPQRFVRYYDAMASSSAHVLGRATTTVRHSATDGRNRSSGRSVD